MGAVTPETCRVALQEINICILLHLLDFYSLWITMHGNTSLKKCFISPYRQLQRLGYTKTKVHEWNVFMGHLWNNTDREKPNNLEKKHVSVAVRPLKIANQLAWDRSWAVRDQVLITTDWMKCNDEVGRGVWFLQTLNCRRNIPIFSLVRPNKQQTLAVSTF